MKLLNELEVKINYKFKDITLLKTAMTHSSYANEHSLKNNERLEFLGDSVLQLAISYYLFGKIDMDEGVLSKTRAKAVCEDALVIFAEKIELSKYLLLGKGEESSGGRNKPAITADTLEALLGAIFLDSNFDTAFRVIEKIIFPHLTQVLVFKDYKSIFQEKVQADKRSIRYEIVRDYGPSNDKTFEANVYMDDLLMGSGIGKTKKEAEQNAAKEALRKEARN